jgi:hypothetical protein
LTSYEADAYFISNNEDYLVVDAVDADDAEFKMMEIIKERYPDARSIVLENMKEISH